MELRNINENINIIENIKMNSIAEEMGVEIGDILISINDNIIKDIIDYKFHISDEYVVVQIKKKNGEIWDLEIEKEYDEDLGIEFSNSLIDRAKSCRNNCMFCFIDQLPKNMRETLYFKDDDSRLSFLQGNFITLTNMSDEDINRIIRYRISPINISVHTTNKELRKKMLNNKNAGKLYDILKRFNQANIEMNAQIVLIPGINDGIELKNTLEDLSKLYPNIESVAVVPVGLTKHRQGLKKVDSYDKDKSIKLLDEIEGYQEKYLNQFGSRFIFASDEFYVLAKRNIPKYDDYEGFPQIENGVGLLRDFKSSIEDVLNKLKDDVRPKRTILIATGTLAYNFMSEIAEMVSSKISGLNIKVIEIKNDFFGHSITVSGLVTGKDLIKNVKKEEFDKLVIPESMLRNGEEIFLDDITIDDLREKIKKDVSISKVNGKDFIDTLIN